MKRIGIAGVGGIGSNVAANLVRSGIYWLRLVDFDRVEFSNLNRQFYFHDQIGRFKVEALRENLQRIRPETEIDALAVRIDHGNCQQLFADCDLVVEGFDRPADKKMLLEVLAGTLPVVSACGISGSRLDTIRRRVLGGAVLHGDFTTDCASSPLFAHKVVTVASHMSHSVLQLTGACNDNREEGHDNGNKA